MAFIPGRSTVKDTEEEETVSTYPNLIAREFIAFGLLCMALFLIAYFFNAPLEQIANPGKTPNPAKAPWYFLGLQELLHYAPPFIAGVMVPGAIVATLCTIPYCKGRKAIIPSGFLVAIIVMPVFDDIIWELVHSMAPGFADTIRVYGFPTFILWIVSFVLLRKYAGSPRFDDEKRAELARRRFYWMFVYIGLVLIVIGQFFRGPGWSWVWPWA
ncbi:MAG TPA: hypothetical protein VNI20_09025 [Fimbriimonadaceae bacterium]|nr:hypothetical protein [Fimbriimonadaceae bacterium]